MGPHPLPPAIAAALAGGASGAPLPGVIATLAWVLVGCGRAGGSLGLPDPFPPTPHRGLPLQPAQRVASAVAVASATPPEIPPAHTHQDHRCCGFVPAAR